MNAYLCAPGFENALVTEIGVGARTAAPGLVTGPTADAAVCDFIYARHILTEVSWFTGASIRGLARSVIDAVWPALKTQMAWRLDVFTTDAPIEPNQPGELSRRAVLLDEVIRDEIATRRKALHRVLTDAPEVVRFQVLLVERDRVLISLATPALLDNGDRWPSAWPGGRAPIEEDTSAPSSAYRKLLEALAWHGRSFGPESRVVDLGASPGGWSWVATRAGAEVVGVDKGAMDQRLLDNPRFRHERTDAFRWQPTSPPFDWLVCDIIAEPERSAELVTRWAEARWFRSAVAHLKVRGEAKPELVRSTERAIRAAGYGYVRSKQLQHDKNEVTLLIRESP